MSADVSRRDFIGSLAAAAVLPSAAVAFPGASAVDCAVDMIRSEICRGSFASFIPPSFEDLRPDRYYELQGGPYKDTGGWGCPYPGMGSMLVEDLKDWDHCRVIDDRMAKVEQQGYYLTVTTYFGSPYRKCGRIYLTQRWLMEFYRRHRDDTRDDWQRRYDEWHDALRASGWKVEYDRMSREELVALGWKGVDIYRKDG